MNRTNSPLQMLHCCPYPINRKLHLNSPALIHVASFSYFPDANLRHDPHKWDACTIFMFTRIYLIPKSNAVRMCAWISVFHWYWIDVCAWVWVCWKTKKKKILNFWFISIISWKWIFTQFWTIRVASGRECVCLCWRWECVRIKRVCVYKHNGKRKRYIATHENEKKEKKK